MPREAINVLNFTHSKLLYYIGSLEHVLMYYLHQYYLQKSYCEKRYVVELREQTLDFVPRQRGKISLAGDKRL